MTPFDNLCIDISPKKKIYTNNHIAIWKILTFCWLCNNIFGIFIFSFGISLRDFLIFIIYRNIKTERGNDFVWHVYIYAFMLNNLQVASFSQIGYGGKASYFSSLLGLLGALFINIYSGIIALCMHISSNSLSISLRSNMIINY